MKITRLEIADYQQFKDFAIDLTYPAGHPKAGEPLDKICLIGQSGTGKTTILNILKETIDFQNSMYSFGNNFLSAKKDFIEHLHGISEHNKAISKNYQIELFFEDGTKTRIIKTNEIIDYAFRSANAIYGAKFYFIEIPFDYRNFTFLHEKTKTMCIFLSTNILEISNQTLKSLNINPNIYLTDEEKDKIDALKAKNIFDFNIDDIQDIWRLFLVNAKEYIREYVTKAKNLTKILISDPKNIQKHIENIENWQKGVFNPFGNIGEKLDIMFNRFHLKMKQNLDFEAPEDVQFVLLQPTNDYNQGFEYAQLSTGTKQILTTAIPLVVLDTKDTIILFDEPERSLYPDVQKDLIKYYTDLAPEAQFFFATHSPLIASQFEPWEIVELKFNEEGKIYREQYYEGENHIDNYRIFPEYLRWDSILTKVFDLEMEGNEKRTIKLNDLANLEVRLRNAPQEQKRAIWEQYEKLANLLDWHIDK